MRIVIVGAGFTGIQLAKRLINEKNEVTLIENDLETVRHASNRLDCSVVSEDGNNLQVLEDAGIAKADALICVTGNDEVNMITCSLVDAVYPDILKIARVRNYSYHTNSISVTKKQAGSFSDKQRPLYGIDYMIHPDVEAAEAIVRAIESGAVSNVVVFEDSDYELSRVTIEKGATLAGQKLQSLRSLTNKPVLIAYIEANGKTSLPSGSTILEAGNSIGVLTKKGDIGEMLELCGTQFDAIKKIALVGAGKIGTLIADRLITKQKKNIISKIFGRHNKNATEFAIVDSDDQLTKDASERYPTAHVFRGDITDEGFLEEEGLTDYDLVICATHNHELNMVVAAYLESLGVGKTVTLVESSSFSEIARKLGVDVSVPLRDTIVDSIMSHLRGKTVTGVHTVSSGDLEIIEFTLPSSSSIVGKTLMEVANPGTYLFMLMKKAGTTTSIIPVGNTVIENNDQIVMIVKADKVKSVLTEFGIK